MSGVGCARSTRYQGSPCKTDNRWHRRCFSRCWLQRAPCVTCGRGAYALTHKNTILTRPPRWAEARVLEGIDTEAGMLSGISRERSIRSNPYWFTEFCNSQCSSHFAAPFIVVRAETSVAESCNANKLCGQPLWNV